MNSRKINRDWRREQKPSFEEYPPSAQTNLLHV